VNMKFDFFTGTRIRFGRGRLTELAEICKRFGRNVLLVTGAASFEKSGRLEQLVDDLKNAGLNTRHLRVKKEPDTKMIDSLRGEISDTDCVLAVGGGSAMDAGKAISSLLKNPGPVTDYLEGLPEGGGCSPGVPAVPLVAVPTTAGTGSEMTKNAVIQVEKWGVKRSMRSENMLPAVAVIDPDLVETAPLGVLAGCGFDTLVHLLESWTSSGASAITDALAETGFEMAAGFLSRLASGNPEKKDFDMISLAAALGGICLSNTGLGAAHGLVSPLCGKTGMPHGPGAGLLLPGVIRANYAFLKEDESHPAKIKLEQAARITGTGGDVEKAAGRFESWIKAFGIKRAGDYGLTEEMAADIASSPSGSIRTNPVKLEPDVLENIVLSTL